MSLGWVLAAGWFASASGAAVALGRVKRTAAPTPPSPRPGTRLAGPGAAVRSTAPAGGERLQLGAREVDLLFTRVVLHEEEQAWVAGGACRRARVVRPAQLSRSTGRPLPAQLSPRATLPSWMRMRSRSGGTR